MNNRVEKRHQKVQARQFFREARRLRRKASRLVDEYSYRLARETYVWADVFEQRAREILNENDN